MLLPETILQFGAGRFLRAFVDRFVQQANEAGQAVGRIVVVQRSADQRSELLDASHAGYSGARPRLCRRRTGRAPRAACNRSAACCLPTSNGARCWHLRNRRTCASSSRNATESGYVLDPDDKLAAPPQTLPAKLTQVLWARFQAKAAAPTMLPCELIERNADKLRELVIASKPERGVCRTISGMGGEANASG